MTTDPAVAQRTARAAELAHQIVALAERPTQIGAAHAAAQSALAGLAYELAQTILGPPGSNWTALVPGHGHR